jgi:hypothetical protein
LLEALAVVLATIKLWDHFLDRELIDMLQVVAQSIEENCKVVVHDPAGKLVVSFDENDRFFLERQMIDDGHIVHGPGVDRALMTWDFERKAFIYFIAHRWWQYDGARYQVVEVA